MSRLAQSWVVSNFTFPRQVTQLEKDFSNGFLFLKILEQKRILLDDEIMGAVDGDTPAVVMKNMNIVNRGLKSLDIHLSKQQIADVCIDSCLQSTLIFNLDYIRATWWICRFNYATEAKIWRNVSCSQMAQ
jgi:hypothetical protein